MSRLFRPFRTIASLSRLPLKIENGIHKGFIQREDVHTVNIPRPPFKKRRILDLIFGGLLIYSTFEIIAIMAEKTGNQIESALPPAEDLEEESGPIFIPFPGTTKEIPSKPYRGSDPEWQAFVKFSKDQELAKRVRDELAQIVVSKSPTYKARGATLTKRLRRYWLDVDFPPKPYPVFERSGLEIDFDEGYLAWGTHPVDSLTVFRTRKILWPTHIFKALWAYTSTAVGDDLLRAGRSLGAYHGPITPNITEMTQELEARRQARLTSQMGVLSPPVAHDIPPPPDQLNLISRIRAHYSAATTAWFNAMQRANAQIVAYPPPGCIVVSGMVEIDCQFAYVTMDVVAHWDTKRKAYDEHSLSTSVRRVQMKMQPPPGGG